MNLHDEQSDLLAALIAYNQVCVLKPRQIGSTTIVLAYLLWRAITDGVAFDVLSVAHEHRAVGRCNRQLRQFILRMPEVLRPKILVDNSSELTICPSPGVECSLRQTMAGGRDQGRSYSYRGGHLTEVGYYPRGSAALAGSAIDEDVFASVTQTMPEPQDDPGMRLVIESTANGPVGLFHKTVRTAIESDEWKFLFFPWFKFRKYARRVPAGFELMPEEQELLRLHAHEGMSLENIAYRRFRVHDQGIGPTRFRKEYPSTWMEPFLVSGGMWFNPEILNALLAKVPKRWRDRPDGDRTFIPYDARFRHYIGVDTSGGVGRDNAVIQVIRDDFAQAHVFSSNTMGSIPLAEKCARISIAYGRAPVLCERNNHGKAFLDRAETLGVNLWKDKNRNDWWTDERTKAMVYDWCRALINQGHATLSDEVTLRECLQIREQPTGAIEADEGFHDDHPMALCLALWNGRHQHDRGDHRPPLPVHEARARRHRELGLGGNR